MGRFLCVYLLRASSYLHKIRSVPFSLRGVVLSMRRDISPSRSVSFGRGRTTRLNGARVFAFALNHNTIDSPMYLIIITRSISSLFKLDTQ